MHDGPSATESCGYDRCESVDAIGDGPQAIHQPLKDSFLLVMIAVADAHSSGPWPPCLASSPRPGVSGKVASSPDTCFRSADISRRYSTMRGMTSPSRCTC